MWIRRPSGLNILPETCLELSKVENNILSIISDMPIHIDNIMKKTNMSREALFKILFKMQSINKIVSLPGNYYAKIN